MKITLTLDLDRADHRLISQCSIERCINTSMEIAQQVLTAPAGDNELELADICLQNWEEMKPVTVHIWHAIQNAIFIAAQQEAAEKQRLSNAAKGSNF